ncbi:hypothetical protein Tco_0842799 [Tanacetum coccineum]|uniref:Uncharacterized protein n=1 Tax=Tanacetum coccineum TaxID=301880 RepID=A0ABQ5B3T9_9ASTR
MHSLLKWRRLRIQGICGHDESCCTIHLYLSISIKDTTIRDTTTPAYTFTYSITTFAFTVADMPEVCLPPQKRFCIALGPRYEVRESSSAPAARPTGGFRADYGFVATLDREIRRDLERDVGYGIIDTLDEMLEGMPGAPVTDETELGRRMTNLVTTVRQDTDEIYGRLDEAQEARAVLSGRFNLLGRDRCSHAYTALLLEREARLSREA